MLFKSIESILNELKNQIDSENLLEFSNCDYHELYNYHFSLGLFIRNNILEQNNELYKLFLKCGIEHIDDMSSLLTTLFYLYIKSENLE